MFVYILTIVLACHSSIRTVRTSIPHDWVQNPPVNCGVGHCELSSVDADLQSAIDIATEYAQFHLTEKRAHLLETPIEEGVLVVNEDLVALETQFLSEHAVVQEAIHVFTEHGKSRVYVLACVEDQK